MVKKIILMLAVALLGITAAQAQVRTMVVTRTDGTVTKFEVAKVQDVKFIMAEHEYVDLGLSVKWATCNVGANNPEEYGDYFAWGETSPKSSYLMKNYKWTTDGCITFTKYNDTDCKTVLDKEDDAAAVNWGGSWRTPTMDEIKELLDNCTWELQAAGNTDFGGVAGMKVTSNIEGYTDKYIFLPLAGDGPQNGLPSDRGELGKYWSATPYASYFSDYDYQKHALFLYIYPNNPNFSVDQTWSNKTRNSGLTIRPVCP